MAKTDTAFDQGDTAFPNEADNDTIDISTDGALQGNDPAGKVPTLEATYDFDDPTATPADAETLPGVASGNELPGDEGEDEFPEAMLEAAHLNVEQAKAQFGTPEALASAITMMDQRSVQAGQQFASPAAEEEEAAADEAPAPAPAPARSESELDWLPEPDDGTDWDEDTKKLLAAMDQRYKTELAARDKELQEQREFLVSIANEREAEEQRQQQVAAAEYVQEFDAFIDAIGEDFAPVFGTGPGAGLDPNSMAFQNRVQLSQTASQLAVGRAAYGQPALPNDELLVRALRVSFPEAQQTAVEHRVQSTVSQRQQQMTTRPTHRGSQEELPPGDAKAIAGAKKWFADHGMQTQDDDYADYDI